MSSTCTRLDPAALLDSHHQDATDHEVVFILQPDKMLDMTPSLVLKYSS